jgi:hypothetical protein
MDFCCSFACASSSAAVKLAAKPPAAKPPAAKPLKPSVVSKAGFGGSAGGSGAKLLLSGAGDDLQAGIEEASGIGLKAPKPFGCGGVGGAALLICGIASPAAGGLAAIDGMVGLGRCPKRIG